MEVRKVDGKTLVVFDASEAEAKRQFERTLASEQTLEKTMEAFIKAIANLEQERRDGWTQLICRVAETLDVPKEILPEVLSYSWVYGGVEVPEVFAPKSGDN
ncbi:MAG: hypothetical protein V7L23_15365 [Nostoc sp.]|uniref:hypothetical protein n=1 Tax=Nostoc sp. TaxID=1180 RepID=UPI002FF11814